MILKVSGCKRSGELEPEINKTEIKSYKMNSLHKNLLKSKLVQSNIYKLIEKNANDNYKILYSYNS